MRVAAGGWLFALFESSAAAQLAFGADWMTAAALAMLIEVHPTLSALMAAPGLDVATVGAGAAVYLIIGMGAVQLWAQPVDGRGRRLDPGDPRAAETERLLVLRARVRGVEIRQVRTA
jgi:hypothetical protein